MRQFTGCSTKAHLARLASKTSEREVSQNDKHLTFFPPTAQLYLTNFTPSKLRCNLFVNTADKREQIADFIKRKKVENRQIAKIK